MNRAWIFIVVALSPICVFAQGGPSKESGSTPPYQPAVPAGSTNSYGSYAGWPGYSSGAQSTVGSALNGMASVISAQGDYNLATSAAAVNLTQAERNAIQNRQQAANTYWEMRNAWRAQRDAQRGPPPTMEQVARLAHYGVPKPLTPNEFDPVSGKLNWPSALQQDSFAESRADVDDLFEAWARYGNLNYSQQTKVRETINAMFDELNAQIKQIPPQVYTECRRFLRSLIYAATKSDLQ
jgi:hypothetical protein